MHAEDPRHEVPPAGEFGQKAPRRTPYIFTAKVLRALLKAAGALGPRRSLRPKTYVTMLGLIAATGLRISEVWPVKSSDPSAVKKRDPLEVTCFGGGLLGRFLGSGGSLLS